MWGDRESDEHQEEGIKKNYARTQNGLEKDARKRADETDRQTWRLAEEEGRKRERKGAGRVAFVTGEGARGEENRPGEAAK